MRILVVGAGLAGLYKAYKLLKKNHDIIVLEESKFLGGQLRTIKYEKENQNYYFDIGPHIPPKNFRDWNQLCSFIDSVNMPLPIKVELRLQKDLKLIFPPNIKNFLSLKKTNLILLLRFILSYIFSSIKKRKEENLENALLNSWGKKFYNDVLFHYLSNFWKFNPAQISKNYKARFSPPRLKKILYVYFENFFYKKKPSASKNLFLYPIFGVGKIIGFLKKEILRQSGRIKKNININNVLLNERDINIEYKENQEIIKEKFDKVFWTGSIHKLAKLLKLKEYSKFKYRKLLNINFKIDKKDLLGNKIHSSYLMIPGIYFHRVYEPKKFSKKMAPNNKTSGCLEITLKKNPENLDYIIEKSIEQFCSVYNVERRKIKYLGYVIYDYAYPLMFKDYELYFDNFKSFLQKKNPNFYLIGRTGSYFQYTIEKTIKSTYPPYSFVE